jgi:hypothetical protein
VGRLVAKDDALEAAFHARMLEIYRRALEHGYRASGFLRIVNELGGVAAAKRWLNEPEVQSGFVRLWELNILKESMEYVVAFERRFSPLFTRQERHIARMRYEAYANRPR